MTAGANGKPTRRVRITVEATVDATEYGRVRWLMMQRIVHALTGLGVPLTVRPEPDT